MNYWESPDRSDRRFIYLQRGDVIAVNAQNGELITSFGNNGRVDLREAMERKPAGLVGTSNPGRIFENLFIIPLPGGAELRRPAVRRPRLRRADRASSPGSSMSFRTKGSSASTRGRKATGGEAAAGTTGASSRSTRRTASPSSGSAARATTSTAAIARATTCSPTRSSRSTPAPASGSGISSSFTTTSGTGTFRSRPSC